MEPAASWPGSALRTATSVAYLSRSAGLALDRSSNVCVAVASSLRRSSRSSCAWVPRFRKVMTAPVLGPAGGFWKEPSRAYTMIEMAIGELDAAGDSDGAALSLAAADASTDAD